MRRVRGREGESAEVCDEWEEWGEEALREGRSGEGRSGVLDCAFGDEFGIELGELFGASFDEAGLARIDTGDLRIWRDRVWHALCPRSHLPHP